MKKIAITGKIGTGKSVLLDQFKLLGYKTYSSDQIVKDLYAQDKYIINEIRKLCSSLVINKKIKFDKLSNKAFRDPTFLLKLEKIRNLTPLQKNNLRNNKSKSYRILNETKRISVAKEHLSKEEIKETERKKIKRADY